MNRTLRRLKERELIGLEEEGIRNTRKDEDLVTESWSNQ